MIQFETVLRRIGESIILRLPKDASDKLPSRGQVMVKGAINSHDLGHQVLEPDGSRGHWLKIDKELQNSIGITVGDTVHLDITLDKDWREPTIPSDFSQALDDAPSSVNQQWNSITPMARWEWIRWINATKVAETRARRIEAAISKMLSGKRRPCCFDLASCTDPELAKSGKLIETLND